jgi:hypothetical protein
VVRDLPGHVEERAGAVQTVGSSLVCQPACSKRAAYQSQFLDPVGRAWRTKAKVKRRLIGDEDPDDWDLPPKPKRMRWSTYERWEAKYDGADDALDYRLGLTVARLMKRV